MKGRLTLKIATPMSRPTIAFRGRCFPSTRRPLSKLGLAKKLTRLS